jgi:hypothetical protein
MRAQPEVPSARRPTHLRAHRNSANPVRSHRPRYPAALAGPRSLGPGAARAPHPWLWGCRPPPAGRAASGDAGPRLRPVATPPVGCPVLPGPAPATPARASSKHPRPAPAEDRLPPLRRAPAGRLLQPRNPHAPRRRHPPEPHLELLERGVIKSDLAGDVTRSVVQGREAAGTRQPCSNPPSRKLTLPRPAEGLQAAPTVAGAAAARRPGLFRPLAARLRPPGKQPVRQGTSAGTGLGGTPPPLPPTGESPQRAIHAVSRRGRHGSGPPPGRGAR